MHPRQGASEPFAPPPDVLVEEASPAALAQARVLSSPTRPAGAVGERCPASNVPTLPAVLPPSTPPRGVDAMHWSLGGRQWAVPQAEWRGFASGPRWVSAWVFVPSALTT